MYLQTVDSLYASTPGILPFIGFRSIRRLDIRPGILTELLCISEQSRDDCGGL